MPVNPYDDRKVSLRRPHGNGDLDILGAMYTRRKANVTEASDVVFIMLINVEMPTIVGILTFMSMIQSMLS